MRLFEAVSIAGDELAKHGMEAWELESSCKHTKCSTSQKVLKEVIWGSDLEI